MNKKLAIGAAVAALAIALAGGVAVATGSDDDTNQTGPEADRAKAAALAVTHGGRVNSVELDNENGAKWEVEVTKPNGETVDVRLDADFGLVVVEGDSDADEKDDDNEN